MAAHGLSLLLPKYELYEVGSQLRRVAKSVPANIAEGRGRRRYKADYVRFLVYAKASPSETEEHLRYVCDCHAAQQAQATLLPDSADTLGQKLHHYITQV